MKRTLFPRRDENDNKRTRALLINLSVLALLLIGFWNFGQGACIYAKAYLAQGLLERAWQQTLTGKPEVRPWPWADTFPVARLRVPSRNIDQIVLSGATGRTLAFGPGYMLASSLPGGGGVTILSGHRDTHFGFLQNLRRGEPLLVQLADGQEHVFTVSDTRVTDAREAGLTLAAQAEGLVLITCYPFNVVAPTGPLRYVVSAVPESSVTALKNTKMPHLLGRRSSFNHLNTALKR